MKDIDHLDKMHFLISLLGEKVDATNIFQPPKVPLPQSTPVHNPNPFYQQLDGRLKQLQLQQQSPQIIPPTQDTISLMSESTPGGLCKVNSHFLL